MTTNDLIRSYLEITGRPAFTLTAGEYVEFLKATGGCIGTPITQSVVDASKTVVVEKVEETKTEEPKEPKQAVSDVPPQRVESKEPKKSPAKVEEPKKKSKQSALEMLKSIKG